MRRAGSFVDRVRVPDQRPMYEHSADVPRPFAQVGNAVLMEYIGELEHPASQLSDVTLEPDEMQGYFESILRTPS